MENFFLHIIPLNFFFLYCNYDVFLFKHCGLSGATDGCFGDATDDPRP